MKETLRVRADGSFEVESVNMGYPSQAPPPAGFCQEVMGVLSDGLDPDVCPGVAP
jgi:hypothetical protein